MKKRLLSLTLSVVMILSMLPGRTLAVEPEGPGEEPALQGTGVHVTQPGEQDAGSSSQSAQTVGQGLHTYRYTGTLDKVHDGEVVTFDPKLMEVDGGKADWATVSGQRSAHNLPMASAYWYSHASQQEWPCEAVDNRQLSTAFPSLPGRYSLVVYEPENPNDSVTVHQVYRQEFFIRAEGTSNGVTVRLPLKQYIKRSEGYVLEQIGVLEFVINGDGRSLTLLDLTDQGEYPASTASFALPESVWVGGKEYAVTDIADRALYPRYQYATKYFQEIALPRTIKTIGERAFGGLNWCSRIMVDPDNPYFASWEWDSNGRSSALYNKDLTRLIAVPTGATGSFDEALHNGYANIPSVTEIGPYAFEDSSLVNPDYVLILPDSVTKLGRGAFLQDVNVSHSGSPGLQSLHIGPNLTQLPWDEEIGFGFPGGLRSIQVHEYNTAYSSMGGLLFNHDATELLYCPGSYQGTVVIPEGVTSVRADAFRGCTGVPALSIPASLTQLDGHALHELEHMEHIAVAPGNPVFSVADRMLIRNGTTLAFCLNGERTAVSLPSAITTIGSYAFPQGSGLEELTMTGSHAILEKNAFTGLGSPYSFRLITGPGTEVRRIDDGAFDGCAITGIDIQHPGPQYATTDGHLTTADRKTLLRAFEGTSHGQGAQNDVLRLPDTIETVAAGAFKDITIPGIELPGVRVIRSGAFEHCYFMSLYLDRSLTTLEDRIFRNCSALNVGKMGPVNTLTISYAGTQEQWTQLLGGTYLCIPDENLPWSPHRPIEPGEHFPPLSTQISCQARALQLRDSRVYSGEHAGMTVPTYPVVGQEVVLMAEDLEMPLSGWQFSPAIEYRNEVRPHPYGQGPEVPVAVFSMPDADLQAEPVYDVSGQLIPVSKVNLTAGINPQGVPLGGEVTASQGAPYTVTSSAWYLTDTDTQGNDIKTGEPVTQFTLGTSYALEVVLTANSGYCFASGVQAQVNGRRASASNETGSLTSTVLFFSHPRAKVMVENGMAAGTDMKYFPENGFGEAYVEVGQPIFVWPVYMSGQTDGNTHHAEPPEGVSLGSESGGACGSGSIRYETMPDGPVTVHFGSHPGPWDSSKKIIHTFMAGAFEGVLANTSSANPLREAVAGTKVTIEAAIFPAGQGWEFDHWVIYDTFNPDPGSGTGTSTRTILPQNPKAELTWFTMPDCEVFVEAVYREAGQRYQLILNDAEVVSNSDGGGMPNDYGYLEVLPGAEITLRPKMAPGRHFGGWQANYPDIVFTGNTFTMPAHSLEIRSLTDFDEYAILRVLGGVAKNENGDIITAAKKGMTVTLEPDQTEEGQVFQSWTCLSEPPVTITGSSFVMDSAPVTVRAEFHTHAFGEWIKDGTGHSRSCSCGEKETAEHSFTDWVTDEAGAKMSRKCLVCGYLEEKDIQKAGHTHTAGTEWHTDPAGHWHVCSDAACGARLDYAAHTFGEWTQDASYAETGKKTRSCACGYTETAYDPVTTVPDPTEITTAVQTDAFRPAAAAQENVTIRINETAGAPSTVTYNTDAVDAIKETIQNLGSSGEDIASMQVRVENITDNTTGKVTDRQQAAIRNTGSGEVLSIGLECLDSAGQPVASVDSFGTQGACTVRIPAPDWFDPDSGEMEKAFATVYRIEEDGTLTAMKDVRFEKVGDQWYIIWFSGSHSVYMITNPNLYGRNQLTDMEKLAYDLVGQGVAARAEAVDVFAAKLDPTSVSRVMTFYINDHPEHYWLMGGYSYSYGFVDGREQVVSILPNYFTTSMDDAAFRAGTAKLLAAAEGKTTDYDKALALHDAIVKNTDYVMDAPNAHNAYGVIAEGQAVCEGYARAYQYLLQQVGVQSYVVTGTAGGGGHAWNLVRLDGNYYYTDTTWDDPMIGGVDEKTKPVFYGYFNLTEGMLTQDHSFDTMYNSIKPDATDISMLYEDYAVMIEPNANAIAHKLCKLNPEGTRLVSRVLCQDIDYAYDWLNTGYADVADAAGIRGGYSVNWMTCGKEIYLNYRVDQGQTYRPFSGQATKPVIERPTNGRFAESTTVHAGELTKGVTLKLEKGVKSGTCVAVIYGDGGKQLAVGTAILTPGTNKVTISCGSFVPAQARTLKLFLLGSGARPIELQAEHLLLP